LRVADQPDRQDQAGQVGDRGDHRQEQVQRVAGMLLAAGLAQHQQPER